MFAPLYRMQQIFTPTLTFVQTGSQCWIKSHISTTTRVKFTITIVNRQLSQNNWKVTQIDLYFLSKPEVEKKKYSRGNVLSNFNMVCILSDVNKIDPNLTFRSSRTPSVCQYKHQSLVFFFFLLLLLLLPLRPIDCRQKNTYLQTSHELETWHVLRT